MKRDSVGRLWPEHAGEHLIFWPVVIVCFVGLFFFARWMRVVIEPYAGAIAKWIVGLF
jgi:hypothetical protein